MIGEGGLRVIKEGTPIEDNYPEWFGLPGSNIA